MSFPLYNAPAATLTLHPGPAVSLQSSQSEARSGLRMAPGMKVFLTTTPPPAAGLHTPEESSPSPVLLQPPAGKDANGAVREDAEAPGRRRRGAWSSGKPPPHSITLSSGTGDAAPVPRTENGGRNNFALGVVVGAGFKLFL